MITYGNEKKTEEKWYAKIECMRKNNTEKKYETLIENGSWRFRNNQEIQEFYKDLDIVVNINKETIKMTGKYDKNG